MLIGGVKQKRFRNDHAVGKRNFQDSRTMFPKAFILKFQKMLPFPQRKEEEVGAFKVHLYTKAFDLVPPPPGISVIWEILLDTNCLFSSFHLTFLTLSEGRICTSKSH